MSITHLAILGGTPAFEEDVHVGRPNIGNRDRFMTIVNEIFDRRFLTNSGPVVGAFEAQLAERLGVRHCIAVSNATLGLELAYAQGGLAGEVIVPSFTFVATVHALSRTGCTPIFCDIDPETHSIDPAQVEALITPRTAGIAAVHLWGRPCDVDALAAIAEAHRLPLIYDAAHAFDCSVGGRPIATFGRASVFSFHATKFLNSFEGGAITTDDADLAHRLRLARSFGFVGHDDVVCLGTNAKLPEISAAMGLVNLAHIDEFIEINRRNHQAYAEQFSGLPGVHLLSFAPGDHPNYQYVVIEVDEAKAGLTRDHIFAALRAERVFPRRYFWPGVHRMEPYRSLYPEVGQRLPHTEQVASRVLVLPTGTAIDIATIDTIGAIVRAALSEPEAVKRAALEMTP